MRSVVRRNKNFPELQELMILLAYELSQMKMMINPIRAQYLPEVVAEYLDESLVPEIFSVSPEKYIEKIKILLV